MTVSTCDPKNTASRRTCEIAGGECIGTVWVPKGTEMYANGRRRVRRYRFDLARLLETQRLGAPPGLEHHAEKDLQ